MLKRRIVAAMSTIMIYLTTTGDPIPGLPLFTHPLYLIFITYGLILLVDVLAPLPTTHRRNVNSVSESKVSAILEGTKRIQARFIHLEGIASFNEESEVRLEPLDEALSFEELARISLSLPYATASLPYSRITDASINKSKTADHLVINYTSESGEKKKIVLDATQESERDLLLRIINHRISPTKPAYTDL